MEKVDNKKKAQAAHNDSSSAEKTETLAHPVISQDHTIRQQIQRITELEAQIESYEAKVHFDRIKRHRINYVQDTYLVDPAAQSSREQRFEEYEWLVEEVDRLQEAAGAGNPCENKSMQVQGELNRHLVQRRDVIRGGDTQCAAPFCTEEREKLRSELGAGLYVGVRLNTSLEAVRSLLGLTQENYAAKEKEMMDLLKKVNSLDREEKTASEEDQRRMKNE